MRCVCDWVGRQQILSRRRGSGRYTRRQVLLYAELQQHVAYHHPVCLNTRAHVGAPEAARGASGESVSKGLAGPHCYAVLDCFWDPDSGSRYLQVFNPWGRIGRGYTFAPRTCSRRIALPPP